MIIGSFVRFLFSLSVNGNQGNESMNETKKPVNFDELEQYYLTIQNRHKESKKQRYRYVPNTDVPS